MLGTPITHTLSACILNGRSLSVFGLGKKHQLLSISGLSKLLARSVTLLCMNVAYHSKREPPQSASICHQSLPYSASSAFQYFSRLCTSVSGQKYLDVVKTRGSRRHFMEAPHGGARMRLRNLLTVHSRLHFVDRYSKF